MKFAKFWQSEKVAVDKKKFGLPELTVWGASNESDFQASVSAATRAEKLKSFLVSNFENKHDYEYWNGYIREQIVEEINDTEGKVLAVLTRNSYGAVVLNTESVLFGDIDLPESGLWVKLLEVFGRRKRDTAYYLDKIEHFQKMNTHLTIQVYQTFAGLRFVVMNVLFSPEDDEVGRLFTLLEVDPLYKRLCDQQSCFRARLTPKPWRIKVERPVSRFPRDNKEQREFETWLKEYQFASAQFSVVKKLSKFGGAPVNADIKRVLAIHDRYTCGIHDALA